MEVFNNLLRIFSRQPRINGKPTMIIPSFADLRDGSQTQKVRRQCYDCACLLSTHLYKWERSFPQKSLVKIWEPESLSFVTLDLEAFGNYLTHHFALYTDAQMMGAVGWLIGWWRIASCKLALLAIAHCQRRIGNCKRIGRERRQDEIHN